MNEEDGLVLTLKLSCFVTIYDWDSSVIVNIVSFFTFHDTLRSVWPDWAILKGSCEQILLQKQPKYYCGVLGYFENVLFLSNNCCGYILGYFWKNELLFIPTSCGHTANGRDPNIVPSPFDKDTSLLIRLILDTCYPVNPSYFLTISSQVHRFVLG